MTCDVFPAAAPPVPRTVFSALRCALIGLLLLPVAARAEEGKNGPAGKLVSDDASVLVRVAVEKPWQPLKKGREIAAGNLLVGLPGAALESSNGAIRLALLSDLDELSPYPILESAVVLHPSKDGDLDFTLDRGRVDLTNQKEKGPARARVRFRNQTWELTLADRGTRVALEFYGRWPAGARFNLPHKPGHGPVTELVLLVLKGQVDLKTPVSEHALSAPPGPALFHWSNVYGPDNSVRKLDKLPAWAEAPDMDSPKARKKKENLERYRKALLASSIEETLKRYINSDDANERRLGVYAAGALDQLSLVAEVLNKSQHADTWHNAVVALRHWLGRAPGQDLILYNRLIKLRGYSPAESKSTIQLLHGFTEEEIARPELYQALIDLLKHQRLAIRGLAQWHLQRLAPGVKIAFNPAGPKEEWEKAHAAWKKEIPRGKLPPAPKLDEKKDR